MLSKEIEEKMKEWIEELDLASVVCILDSIVKDEGFRVMYVPDKFIKHLTQKD